MELQGGDNEIGLKGREQGAWGREHVENPQGSGMCEGIPLPGGGRGGLKAQGRGMEVKPKTKL